MNITKQGVCAISLHGCNAAIVVKLCAVACTLSLIPTASARATARAPIVTRGANSQTPVTCKILLNGSLIEGEAKNLWFCGTGFTAGWKAPLTCLMRGTLVNGLCSPPFLLGKSSGREYFIRNTSFGSGELILEKADDASQATGCEPLLGFFIA